MMRDVEDDDGIGFEGVSILSPMEKDTEDVLRVRVVNMERERRCCEGGGGAGLEADSESRSLFRGKIKEELSLWIDAP